MTSTLTRYHPLLSAIIVLLCCWVLFWLDHETRGIADLFSTGNLVALVIYFVPTYVICLALHALFERRSDKLRFMLSLSIGIPLGFSLVILLLSWWMERL
jgi:hypothetical protein